MFSYQKNSNINFDNIELLTWQEAYSQHVSSFQEQTNNVIVNNNFEQLILGRTFYPRPFISSSIQHVISLPWATEYFVLPYWFFFFSLGLVSIWLIILYVQTTLHLESRFLRRETRGFSRAQTGDALTSVVPLAWSISMLMHASVHSFNFDDNTAGTVFSFNVLAYQWGWNYYFPSDLLKLFKEGPKRVGRNSIENFSNIESYNYLLSRYRTEYVKKVNIQGSFSNKNIASFSPLSFFIQTSNSDVSYEPIIFVPFFNQKGINNVNTTNCNTLENLSLLKFNTIDLINQIEQTNSQYINVYSWFNSSVSVRLLDNFSFSSVFFSDYTLLDNLNHFFFIFFLENNGEKFILNNNYATTYKNNNFQFSPFRSPYTLSLSGNRYFLIHKHLTDLVDNSLLTDINIFFFLKTNFFFNKQGLENLNFKKLPLGVFNSDFNTSILSSMNISSVFLKNENLGFGSLSLEDFGFTNSAASNLVTSLSANTVLFNSTNNNDFFKTFSLKNSVKSSFFFLTDFTNDWSSSFLISLYNQSWMKSSLVFSNSSKVSFSYLAFFSLYQNYFNYFSSFFFNFFSQYNLNLNFSWIDLLFTNNFLRNNNKLNLDLSKTFLSNCNSIEDCRCFFFYSNVDFKNFIFYNNDYIVGGEKKIENFFSFNQGSNSIFIFTSNFSVYFPVYNFFVSLKNKNNSLLNNNLDYITISSFFSKYNWYLKSSLNFINTQVNFLHLNTSRSFSSRFLNGIDFSKPAKNFSSYLDPNDFSNGSVGLFFSPWLHFVELFNWSTAWINFATIANAPSYKIWKGGFVRRHLSNELSSFYSPFFSFEPLIKNAQLSKLSTTIELPKTSLLVKNNFFFEQAPAVLDKEWAPFILHTSLDLPSPFEDLDPFFIHKRWTTDINTTRRTDHSARYLVGSGPVLASQKNKSKNYFSSFWFSSIGPQGYKALTPKKALTFSTSSLFYNYPNYSLANTQFLLGSSSLNFYNDGQKGYPMVSSFSFYLTSRVFFGFLKSLQDSYKSQFFFSFDFCLNNNYSSIWTFRPSVFSQNRVRNFGQNITYTPYLDMLTSYLLTFQNQNNFFFNFLKKDLFEQQNNHVLNNMFVSNSASIFKNFFSYLSDNFVYTDSLKKDLYSLIPEDVRSIKRLRTSKAVCLPSDIPMHIVCGSKDVIHSWAIPGLGIKIDCIPGFSSHRRLTIRWRGTFWGQCMEVCGRYHHWMPILIHITHRDLFLSWCLSFLKALEVNNNIAPQVNTYSSQFLTWLSTIEAHNKIV